MRPCHCELSTDFSQFSIKVFYGTEFIAMAFQPHKQTFSKTWTVGGNRTLKDWYLKTAWIMPVLLVGLRCLERQVRGNVSFSFFSCLALSPFSSHLQSLLFSALFETNVVFANPLGRRKTTGKEEEDRAATNKRLRRSGTSLSSVRHLMCGVWLARAAYVYKWMMYESECWKGKFPVW